MTPKLSFLYDLVALEKDIVMELITIKLQKGEFKDEFNFQ